MQAEKGNRLNSRLVKEKYSYSIPELAGVLKVHSNTVSRWKDEEGLPLLDDAYPPMVYGADAINFLNIRKAKSKTTLKLQEFYCFKCKCASHAQDGVYSVQVQTEKVGMLKAVCCHCGKRMNKNIHLEKLPEIEELFKSLLPPVTALIVSEQHTVNSETGGGMIKQSRNPENERIKHKYFDYERDGNGKSEKTLENIRKALIRYEEFTHHTAFKTFNAQQATAYKNHLLKASNANGKPLVLQTVSHALCHLMDFFKWLAARDGYKKSIRFADIVYLKLNDRDRHKIAPAKLKDYPSPEQVKKVIASMPAKTDVETRNRAIVALVFATGIRDGALIGLKMKHINAEKGYVVQDPREVETKFGKHINSKFLPVGEDIHHIIREWVQDLREVLLFGDNDPLFPKEILQHNDKMNFVGGTLSREHWQSATAIRGIFKQAFLNAGLKPYPPHRFRDTLSAIGRQYCTTIEEQMAWARNMGHESPQTTFIVYGGFSPERQFEVLDRLAGKMEAVPENQEDIARALQLLNKAFNGKTA